MIRGSPGAGGGAALGQGSKGGFDTEDSTADGGEILNADPTPRPAKHRGRCQCLVDSDQEVSRSALHRAAHALGSQSGIGHNYYRTQG
jgi:hypothetical protein